ncbi:hypothetical protein F4818DRAFT_101183 [Hypoxylon cercidicola]|nr:hypothetical protein F4818DRAFT_101183 [Hypoxylon cercidicola]
MDWWNEAITKEYRKAYTYGMRHRREDGRTKRYIRDRRARRQAEISRKIKQGYVDKENTLARSRCRRAVDHVLEFGPMEPLGRLKQAYDDFREWRQERKNDGNVWKMTAVMEDVGDKPEWRAEMTFKIPSRDMIASDKPEKWFEFPGPENIKWWWVVRPSGREYVVPPSVNHWGPEKERLSEGCILPLDAVRPRGIQHRREG